MPSFGYYENINIILKQAHHKLYIDIYVNILKYKLYVYAYTVPIKK